MMKYLRNKYKNFQERLKELEIYRYKIIKKYSEEYPVKYLCEAMSVNRSRYYKWLNRDINDKKNVTPLLVVIPND